MRTWGGLLRERATREGRVLLEEESERFDKERVTKVARRVARPAVTVLIYKSACSVSSYSAFLTVSEATYKNPAQSSLYHRSSERVCGGGRKKKHQENAKLVRVVLLQPERRALFDSAKTSAVRLPIRLAGLRGRKNNGVSSGVGIVLESIDGLYTQGRSRRMKTKNMAKEGNAAHLDSEGTRTQADTCMLKTGYWGRMESASVYLPK